MAGKPEPAGRLFLDAYGLDAARLQVAAQLLALLA
jgi:hypothetical protein